MKFHFGVPKRVPWFNHDEWLDVCTMIYDQNPEVRAKALQRIKVWSLRTVLPVSVEASLSLREVYDLDHYFNDRKPKVSEKCLREMYTTAFIRFVNGVLDQYQTGVYAKSIAKIAEEISFPRVFVDIRHDGTHNQLPSLEMLRHASKFAFEWLQTNYWSVRIDLVAQLKNTASDLMKRYTKAIKDKGGRNEMDSILDDLNEFAPCFEDVVFPALTREIVRTRKGDSISSEDIDFWKPFIRKFEGIIPVYLSNLLELFASIEDHLFFQKGLSDTFDEMLPKDKNSKAHLAYLVKWYLHYVKELKIEDYGIILKCSERRNSLTSEIAIAYSKMRNISLPNQYENYLVSTGILEQASGIGRDASTSKSPIEGWNRVPLGLDCNGKFTPQIESYTVIEHIDDIDMDALLPLARSKKRKTLNVEERLKKSFESNDMLLF